MARIMNLGFWFGVCGVIVAFANFVDKYHLRNQTKDALRKMLIRVFLFLDRPSLPDPATWLYKRVVYWFSERRWLWRFALLPAGYLIVTSTFFIGRILAGDPPDSPYWEYVLHWLGGDDFVFWFGVVTWVLLLGWISMRITALILARWNRARAVIRGIYLILALMTLVVLVVVSSVGLVFLGFFVLNLYYPQAWWRVDVLTTTIPLSGFGSGGLIVHPAFVILLTSLLSAPMIILTVCLVILTCLQWLLSVMKFVATNMLDAASAPDNSPFTYLAALLALIVMAVKLATLGKI